MIRREDMSPEMWEAMCTPMNVVLPANAKTGFGALYIGSWFASMDSDLLQSSGIRSIVEALDSPWATGQQQAASGYELYKVAIQDSSSADLRSHLDGACKHIHEVLRKGKNVLVYCQQGVSRSSSIIIAYMIKWHAMNYDTALKFLKERRRCAKPNSGFEKTLREWDLETKRGQIMVK